MVDISGLLASAIELLKQLLASVAGKEGAKSTQQQPECPGVIDKLPTELNTKTKDVAESSVQREARGNKVNAKPYYHWCLTKGHYKEECVTPL
jgi:hypothetical protein